MWAHWCVLVVFTLLVTVNDQAFGVKVKAESKVKAELKNVEKVRNIQPNGHLGKNITTNGLQIQVKVVDSKKIRRRRKPKLDTSNLKVKLHNGSSLHIRKASSKNETVVQAGPRVARGYQDKKKGYKYKKPGYVYTTPSTTTRLPPLVESEEENDSQGLGPPDEDPTGIKPDRDFVTNPPLRLDRIDIRDNIPGEPGKDYQVYSTIPETNFTCEGRTPGFYADPETGCQVFHRCTDDPWYTGQVRVSMDSFLCSNGSLFNQQILSCDWWQNVDCPGAQEFYSLNEQIGQLEETEAGIEYVRFGGVRVPPPPGHKQNAPKIIPKNKRQPLPEQYRTKVGYDSEGNEISNYGNGGKALSSVREGEDPEIAKFLEDVDNRGFSEFSAGSNKEGDEEIKEREESSQNIEEVTIKAPKSKKSRKKSKKVKTTTTTPPPEEDEDETTEEDEDETTEEDGDGEEEEEPAATNNNDNASGFIVNRRPGQEDQGSSQGMPPKEVLEPPNFSGDPVDGEKEEDSTEDGTYIPPTSTEGPTYIPPTTQEPKSGGYSSAPHLPPQDTYLPPKPQSTYLPPTTPQTGGYTLNPNYQRGYNTQPAPPNNAYLPPQANGYSQPQQNNNYLPPNNTYLPPQNFNAYLPPQQNNAYLPPQQNNAYLPAQQNYNAYLPPQNNAYLPPQQQNNAYLPPQQNNAYLPPQQQNNAYLPPQNNAYLPPQQQNNAYLPPQQNNAYLPPQQQNNAYLPPQQNNAYLPPQQQNNAYLPPQQNNAYLPPQQQNNAYLPPQQNNAYLPAQQNYNAYLPPQNQINTYLPPQRNNSNNSQGYPNPNPPNRDYLPPQNQVQQYLPVKSQSAHLPQVAALLPPPPNHIPAYYGQQQSKSQYSVSVVKVPLLSYSHSQTPSR